jgi:Second Messenger Oligonucleotide or Dinucleotide Synthetase domain
MELPSYFADFLREIRPTSNQVDDLRRGHTTLRERLRDDAGLSSIYVSDFLQGSYRRATAVRPKGEARSDVDVIVVTDLDRQTCTPQDAIDLFIPFMEKHYKGKYQVQGRSIGISLTYVDLDLVVTSAPPSSDVKSLKSFSVISDTFLNDRLEWTSNAVQGYGALNAGPKFLFEQSNEENDWRGSPLYIPDRDAAVWKRTHPREQIRWTWRKNEATDTHYVNVVKAITWWRREMASEPKHPKGYPLEHLIGECCPDGITSIAQGVTRTLETIATRYARYAVVKSVPELSDRGVPEHNVMHRVSGDDFAAFHALVTNAASLARRALDADSVSVSANLWHELFGSKFPDPPIEKKSQSQTVDGSFTPRDNPTIIGTGRFA